MARSGDRVLDAKLALEVVCWDGLSCKKDAVRAFPVLAGWLAWEVKVRPQKFTRSRKRPDRRPASAVLIQPQEAIELLWGLNLQVGQERVSTERQRCAHLPELLSPMMGMISHRLRWFGSAE